MQTKPQSNALRQPVQDYPLQEVLSFLRSKTDLTATIAKGLRQSFDEVIDGQRTGRFRLEQLEKTEKTYIGTKVEIVIRSELDLERGSKLDNLIAGHEVDTKFSLSGDWMIPREAIGQICLLIKGDDNSGIFSAGLLRMAPEVLNIGANQDGKTTVSAAGKKKIDWLVHNQAMHRNFLLDIDDETREIILSQVSGKQRIISLFKNVTGKIIPRSAIVQVGQAKDPLKRAREAKAPLASQGFQILCATYARDRAEFNRHGFSDFKDDDWLSIRTR